jgi:L-fucose isomerase-like protein
MKEIGFVCFGEVNTPFERLRIKHDDARQTLGSLGGNVHDAGIVVDDAKYETADAAIAKLAAQELDCLVLCVAGWVPTHAVIRVADRFRQLPVLLWGLCGWMENGHLVTTADQAGTTAIRPALQAMHYRFKYIYSVIGKPAPVEKIRAFTDAAYTARMLRSARVGTMGYRDMLLYGTQFEGNSMRGQLGVEVEPFEMLEVTQSIAALDQKELEKTVAFVKENWVFDRPCEDGVIETGVKYALAVGKKIAERGYDAVTLIDVDGMKKLLGFPPAMVFMLLEHRYGVLTIPENDVMGAVTQLIAKGITGEIVPYLEYYEFFEKSMLIGVPDFIPSGATDGDVHVLPTAFGLLSQSLLNVSRVKTGLVTCLRLVYQDGRYGMHMYLADAKTPAKWEECGWTPPAPQLPSLEAFPKDCTVEEFAQKVSSQHVIVCYGDCREAVKDFCKLMDIDLL